MIPIESDLNAKDNVIPLSFVTEKLNNCGNKLNIIILDACRADKKNKTFKSKVVNELVHSASKATSTSTTKSRQVKPDLAIIFSCDPGRYANDGGNSKSNSTFTGVLLNHLSEKELTLDQMMRRVKHMTQKISKQKQRPWINLSLSKIFHFNDGLYEK